MIVDAIIFLSSSLAAAYCWFLSRKLKNFSKLDNSIALAIRDLSLRVEAVKKESELSRNSEIALYEKINKERIEAEDAVRRLEILLAALHDFPDMDEKGNVA